MKRVLFTASTVVVALLLALVVTEGLLRLLNLPHEQKQPAKCKPYVDGMTQAHSTSVVGAYAPGSSYTFCTSDYQVRYTADSLGYLGVLQKDPEHRPLVVFGDSFAYGLGVEPEKSFAHLLDGYNAGLWGMSFDTHVLAFRRVIDEVNPTQAIWVLYPPHLITISDGSWMSRRVVDKKKHPLLFRAVAWFNSTKLSALLITTTGVGWNRSNYETLEYSLYDAKDQSLETAYSSYEAAVVQVTAMARSRGVQLIPVFVPSRTEWALAEGHRPPLVHFGHHFDSDLAVNRMSRILEDHGVPATQQIRLRPLIAKAVPRWEDLYFKSDAHWNASGHAIVAQIIAAQLRRIQANSGLSPSGTSAAGRSGTGARSLADLSESWVSPPYAASNFSAGGSMTWTVDRTDVTTYEYFLTGKAMVVAFNLSFTSVGGTPDQLLRIAIPGGFVPYRTVQNLMMYNNNGGADSWGRVLAVKGQPTLWLFRPDNAPWSASANKTNVTGEITFEVQ
ncbi:MAG TPA: hypothetical protein VNN25_21825 [Thermoanaerobaculia bacterium]|nr:hypothetical protein [Thermoanaerobaculia bacterium]